MRRQIVSITTAADGSGTGYAPPPAGGAKLYAVRYVADGTIPYANTVTFTLTEEDSAQSYLATGAIAASTTFYPRAATVDPTNAANLYAAAGQAVHDLMPVAGRLKIVLATGGNAKAGQFYVYFE
jgi:hypothetical protein